MYVAEEESITTMLRQAQSLHILGAGLNKERPAHQAFHDLNKRGWRLVAIHPQDAGGSILGFPIRQRIDDGLVPEIVVFFLAPQRANSAVREFILRYPVQSMPFLWFQPGSEDDELFSMLDEAGLDYMRGDCIVKYILRNDLFANHHSAGIPWFRQVASPDLDGCSHWSVMTIEENVPAPSTALEWCGDLLDLENSLHPIARYIRSQQTQYETLLETGIRLAS